MTAETVYSVSYVASHESVWVATLRILSLVIRAFFIFYFLKFLNLTYSLPVVTKDLPISPRFTPYIFFIAMHFQHTYNSSTNG